jgi:hypothetical protein
MTIAELVNHIHIRTRRGMPAVTDVEPRETTVLFTIGFRRYMCDTELRVLEIRDGKVFASPHADYQQGVLRGGKRDEHGNLLVEK